MESGYDWVRKVMAVVSGSRLSFEVFGGEDVHLVGPPVGGDMKAMGRGRAHGVHSHYWTREFFVLGFVSEE